MGRWQKVLDAARAKPTNVRFRDLYQLAEHVGYLLDRQRGSHRIYRHSSRRDVPIINLQVGDAGKAKPYQVRQVVGVIDGY